MMRSYIVLLCTAAGLGACAHRPEPIAEGQQTADAGYIRFVAPLGDHEPEHNEAANINRQVLRDELFLLDSEIANRQAQITHFKMLGDNLWNNQTEVLKTEIAALRVRKAQLEEQLQ